VLVEPLPEDAPFVETPLHPAALLLRLPLRETAVEQDFHLAVALELLPEQLVEARMAPGDDDDTPDDCPDARHGTVPGRGVDPRGASVLHAAP
jgi:hypothetical protein